MQVRELVLDVGSDVLGGAPQFGAQLLSSVDNRDHVLEVMAGEMVSVATTVKRFQLGSDEVDGRDESQDQPCELSLVRGVHRGPVPSIGESENSLVNRHDVYGRVPLTPSTGRRSLTNVFRQTKPAESSGQRLVLAI